MRTVLYIKASDLYAGRTMQDGFMGYARGLDWNVQSLDPMTDLVELRRLIAFWRPDGAVVNCGSGLNDFASANFRCPVVYLNRPASRFRDGDSCIYHDSAATAELAARELLSGNREAFGYVGWSRPLDWDRERREAFTAAVTLNRHRVSVFDPQGLKPDDGRLGTRLVAWLIQQPRPIGVFASTDIMAAKVLAAAAKAGIAVPEELSVVGVDNDSAICENTRPTLSSIEPDWRLAGRLAAEALERLIAEPAAGPIRRTYPPAGLVRRQSSHVLRHNDREVAAALELIRREACAGLTAARVARTFPCSRRMAEIRFRKLTGKSFLQAIRAVRLEKAMTLLKRGGTSLAAIADFCGYNSQGAFSAFIRSETGRRPSEI